MKHVTKSGLVLEGTLQQINIVLQKLGEPLLKGYFSESKQQWFNLQELSDEHLRNAILKRMREYLDKCQKLELKEFNSKVTDFGSDDGLYDLFLELSRRVKPTGKNKKPIYFNDYKEWL